MSDSLLPTHHSGRVSPMSLHVLQKVCSMQIVLATVLMLSSLLLGSVRAVPATNGDAGVLQRIEFPQFLPIITACHDLKELGDFSMFSSKS